MTVYNPLRTGRMSLNHSLRSGREFENLGDDLRQRHAGNVEDIDQERRRLNVGANSAVQQKFQAPAGGSFAQRLEQSIRRGKARQGIVNRGDNAIRNQRLKDRLMLAKGSVSRRGALQQTAINATRLKAGLAETAANAKSRTNQAFAGALGSIAGGAVRGFADKFGSSEVPVETDLGTKQADFFGNTDWSQDYATGSGSIFDTGYA